MDVIVGHACEYVCVDGVVVGLGLGEEAEGRVDEGSYAEMLGQHVVEACHAEDAEAAVVDVAVDVVGMSVGYAQCVVPCEALVGLLCPRVANAYQVGHDFVAGAGLLGLRGNGDTSISRSFRGAAFGLPEVGVG